MRRGASPAVMSISPTTAPRWEVARRSCQNGIGTRPIRENSVRSRPASTYRSRPQTATSSARDEVEFLFGTER